MAQNMDVLIVEPGKAPRPAVIHNTLESVEAVLGGAVQVGCFLPQKVLLFSREDTTGLAPNRCLPGGNGYINGTFLLCGIPEKGCLFDSLTAGQQKEFQDIFARPGEFMIAGNTVYANPDDVADVVYEPWENLPDDDTVVLTKWSGTESEA